MAKGRFQGGATEVWGESCPKLTPPGSATGLRNPTFYCYGRIFYNQQSCENS